jgi:acetylornithine deacetylase/succinyl-diaminopimelate desuccinylase family protein
MVFEYDVVQLLQKLIQIRSENGPLGEQEIGDFLWQFLQNQGFHCIQSQMSEGRKNIIAILTAPNDDKINLDQFQYIIFSGHMDTVPGYDTNNSAEAPIKDGKIYGRGACDMKGGIAAFIFAALQFKKSTTNIKASKKRLALVFTVDEEHGCQGIQYLENSQTKPILTQTDYCILAEPTNLNPIFSHKGIAWYIVNFKGTAAHASVPFLGDNAIYKAARFVTRIQEYYGELQTKKSLLGSPAINVGMIVGGTQPNVVPNECEVKIDRRFVPGENVEEERNTLLRMAKVYDPAAECTTIIPGHAYFLPEGKNNPIYKQIAKFCPNTEIDSLPAYTEADYYFRKYRIPTIILGPGDIRQAHQTPEYIEIKELEKAVGIYLAIMKDFFNPN